MKAFKGFNKNIESVMGNGKKESCTFELGKTYREKESKTIRSGFHCCENPFECLSYYGLNGKNRFFKVEATGDINEDDGERIACTEITLLEELSLWEFAYYGMEYMLLHPRRKKWKQNHVKCIVGENEVETEDNGGIAIARGKNPKVRGKEGSILGIIKENDNGIVAAKMFVAKDDNWYRLAKNRKVTAIK